MRDLLVAAIVFGTSLVALRRPWIGVLLCAWLGYMNPHRLCYGFAYHFPFYAIAALATLIGVFFSPEPKNIPVTREIVVLLLFITWMSVTVQFALNPQEAWPEWSRVMKEQVMLFVALILMTDRLRLHLLAWTIALSLGFFGFKGGLFTLATGAHYIVRGPEYSYIEDRNHLALALIMTIPLMRYLQLNTESKRLRVGLTALMVLTALSVLGSYSRAGLLALGVMGILLWLKSRKKIVLGLLMAVTILALLAFMPAGWSNRMHTIETYQQDASAQGRINAWWFAYNLAKERPLIGGGFKTFTPGLFLLYAPHPKDWADAHSIYFQVLGEQGFPGLVLFLLLGVFTWRSANWVIRRTKAFPHLKWAGDLAGMSQVALAAYAVGGATLRLAYFDLPYHLLLFIVLCKVIVKKAGLQPEGGLMEHAPSTEGVFQT